MKKLLVILGAGSSIEMGMPSVKEIDDLFDSWANESFFLKTDKSRNLYRWVKDKIDEHYKKNGDIISEQNFETILYTIQTLATITDKSKRTNRLKAFIELKELPQIENFGQIFTPSSSDFQRLQSILTDRLLFHIREKCKTIEVDKQREILQIRNFFNLLKEDYELGFINLNYDNVILSALPDLSTGYNRISGDFDKEQFYNNDWNFCYHIHGSVHFDMIGKGFGTHDITWNNDLNSSFSTISRERNVDFTNEGNYNLNSTIITGLDKANQILREPFGQYYMKIDKLIHESDSILFIGYGFGDLHLNKLFPFHRLNPVKKRQVVVIDYFPNETKAIYKRQDSWPNKLWEPILFDAYEMGNGSINVPPDTIIEYKKTNTFEFSRNEKFPLSIWHNGFMSACENGQIIRQELLK